MRYLISAFLALFATMAGAAPLSTAQQTALKAAAVADPVANTYVQAGDDVALATWFNADQPAYIVWRTRLTMDTIIQDVGFDFTRVDNLSTGKARISEWMFRSGYIDPSKPNVRAGIDATWVGTAADLSVRATIYAMCKRSASRAEMILATGTGTTASPSTMGFEGVLTYIDASNIRTLP